MSLRSTLLLAATLAANLLVAQPPAGGPPRPPQFVSPEVQADRSIAFRIFAPTATDVKLNGGDIPGNNGPGKPMTKGENGVWEVTLGPVGPGAYRYNFNVNGVSVIDPRNPSISESNNNAWSMVVVPGSEFFDTRDVPHGAVAAVTYQSKALGRARRMHVYTPPGYEMGKDKYPVFYLLHGAGDCDESWTSVGRAGFILDNLIAAKKAKPMIVVMPAGHTTAGGFRATGPGDEFAKDFTGDIMPYIETHYRTQNNRAGRAIAGLSMGGMQTLNIAVPHLDKFSYVGVFSSGLIQVFGANRPGAQGPGGTPEERLAAWEKEAAAGLEKESVKKGLKLFWLGIGKDDFLLDTHKKTVATLQKHGFSPVVKETEGGHTWINWRNYLSELTPQLFQ
jgi:enterochelin esterase-like enzyme